eukprot:CAMPEP_0197315478 /NCGR_PEP_ID=MMETSP0891-20130614/38430_1 /TAXON_ID=44058 ORGANISM="Aureoumbra lagunensis, Strain CCMP1510" /NCGR_SAMPLE_ID=MMETSP0891 /ASSEMBLY_ACC=CAM_ASM_000534 /LENGTH=388 /DNA_ID=CAMNT_0042804445 /DNA_START=74 /DNA_END=1240 /DNA_ORIENTATION=-
MIGCQLLACVIIRHRQTLEDFAQQYYVIAAEIACQRSVQGKRKILRCCGPMVGASELAFRLTVRAFGIDLTWTPMIDADGFTKSYLYRKEMIQFHDNDPTVAQLGGRDRTNIIHAAKLLAQVDQVKAVELNCGCPMRCARKGRYGAFLLNEPDLLCSIVQGMRSALHGKALCAVKIRIYKNDPLRTLNLCRRLTSPQECGAQILTVHGRSVCKEHDADWNIIRQIKTVIPKHVLLIANGDVRSLRQLRLCAAFTACDGVMAARALLKDPESFSVPSDRSLPDSSIRGCALPPFRAALLYLKWVEIVGAPWQCIQRHLTEILERPLRQAPHLRKQFTTLRSNSSSANELESLYKALNALSLTIDSHQQDTTISRTQPPSSSSPVVVSVR